MTSGARVGHGNGSERWPWQLQRALAMATAASVGHDNRGERRMSARGQCARTLTLLIGIALTTLLPACRASPAPVTTNLAIRAAESIPDGTLQDADTLLLDVRSLDSTIVVDMRYRSANNFTGAPLPGYEANRAFLHRDAARALARVQRALRAEGLGLKVFDAYRPVRATLAMVAWTRRVGRESLVRDGYISDRSRHNLGVAIDCTLVDRNTGLELDMGTPFDTFAPAAHTANAAGTVAVNRARFVAEMALEGFANYDQEWWHYSFSVSAPRRFDVVIR